MDLMLQQIKRESKTKMYFMEFLVNTKRLQILSQTFFKTLRTKLFNFKKSNSSIAVAKADDLASSITHLKINFYKMVSKS